MTGRGHNATRRRGRDEVNASDICITGASAAFERGSKRSKPITDEEAGAARRLLLVCDELSTDEMSVALLACMTKLGHRIIYQKENLTMKTKAELRREHGTPAQFREAIRKAISQGMITIAEGESAIRQYEREYADAPKK